MYKREFDKETAISDVIGNSLAYMALESEEIGTNHIAVVISNNGLFDWWDSIDKKEAEEKAKLMLDACNEREGKCKVYMFNIKKLYHTPL